MTRVPIKNSADSANNITKNVLPNENTVDVLSGMLANRGTVNRFHDKRITAIDCSAEVKELRKLRDGRVSEMKLPVQEVLRRVIEKYQKRLAQVKQLYDRYAMNDIPILHDRQVCDPNDIDNRVANDFVGEIVEGKAGYFAGKPMRWVFPDEAAAVDERFANFRRRNHLDDLFYEVTKKCGIGGYGALLMYPRELERYNDSGMPETYVDLAVKEINPWEVIFLGGDGYDSAEFGVRYYTYHDITDKEIHRVELYMARQEHIFEGTALNELAYVTDEGDIINDTEVSEEVTPLRSGIRVTMFSKCPLIGYENNAELLGDIERVLTLIDDYDRVMSDTSSELEANRGAILLFLGVDPPKKGNEWDFKSSMAAYLPNRNKDIKQDAKFITKDIPSAAKESHLERTEDNIYRFAKQPNMSEKKTGIAVSGEALKQRMAPLENKTASFERKFSSANIRLLECVRDFYYFDSKMHFDPYEVEQKFVRNLPVDTKYEAETLIELLNVLPAEKAYAATSLSDAPKEDAEWYEGEGEKRTSDMMTDIYGGDDSGEATEEDFTGSREGEGATQEVTE